MHQTCEHEDSTDDADGDMPGDDLLPEHIHKSQQQSQCTNLTHRSSTVGMVTEEETHGVRQFVKHRSIATLNSLFHDGKRSGTRLCVKITGQLSHLGPCRHLCREGNQQGGTSYQCRIEEIITQSSKGHLTNTDGKQSTDDDNPDREVAGEIETKQQTRQDGRTVADGSALVFQHKLIDSPFEEDAGCDTRSTDNG